ncbi:MAG TPA: DUF1015 family protein [Candidatus Krumholzibacteria bacterium]|nr:DUF1015 family protein [Candidatus Krumholzibacteria bacterium]HPD72525.1 DUF1015 family protein [Candidatus Krumholzibacteria bacterium]HRY40543.1 DUF1015 family protein [Candidatus Krumholzibacteria bacterium]
MSDIRPFRGLRPRPDLVAQVASPPYDVLSSAEARVQAAGNPHSFLHINKAEIDLPEDVDVHSDAVYERSAENFRRFIADGIFVRDPQECFYVYRLRMGGHVQHGIVAGFSVQEYEDGLIKKHELTRREKEDDRARHVEKLMANAGPVLLTFRNRPQIRAFVARTIATAPAVDFTAKDGIGHALWVVKDAAAVKELREAFAAVPATYVADGHHRSASAFRVRNNLRARNPRHSGQEGYNHFLAVAFPDDELKIMGYHRVVQDLNGLSAAEFLARVEQRFDVAATTSPEPRRARSFSMYLDGRWTTLTARPGTFPADHPVRSLDAAILQDNLLAPVLGIDDPRTSNRIDFVGGIRGTGELERRCRTDMKIAFALYPVSVAQLMAIADAGEIMPPKSTWFEPKLRSGVVVRTLD